MKVLSQIVNANSDAAIITDINLKVLSMNLLASKQLKEKTESTNTIYLLPVDIDLENFNNQLKEQEIIKLVKFKKQHSNNCFYAKVGIIELNESYILWTIITGVDKYETFTLIKDLFEAIPIPVFYKDRQGIYLGCNTLFLNLIGRKRSDVIGKKLHENIDEDIARFRIQKDYELLETMNPQSYEWFVQTVTGKLNSVKFNKNIVKDSNGEVIGLIGTIQDITDYKRIEQALVESESLFRSYIENSIDVFFTLDTNGCFTYVSPNWTNVLGHLPGEVIGKSFADFVHPDDIPTGYDYIKKIIEQGTTKESLEYRAKTTEGNYRWQSSFGSTLRRNGNIEIIGIAHDITDLKNSETRIQESYETYRGLIDQLSESVYIQDKNGVFLDVNKSAIAMYGYDSHYMIGKTPDAFAAPGMNDLTKISQYQVLAYNGQPQSFEYWAVKKDGTIFPKEVRISPGNYFGKKCTIAIAFDIKERKNYENELKRYSAFQKTLVDLSIMFINIDIKLLPNAINYALEETGKFINADRAYVFLYDNINKTTSNIHEWCAPSIRPTIEINQNIPFASIPEQLEKHVRNEIYVVDGVEEMENSELKTIFTNEKIKSLITFPLFIDQQCYGFVGFDSVKKKRTWEQSQISLIKILIQLIVNTDLRVLHEKSIIDARDAALEANNSKSNFIANISHEIRTPLNSIIGFTELLARKVLDSKHQQYIKIINNSAYLLNDLINSVLDFSKLGAGKFQINPEDWQFKEIIDFAINTFAPEAFKKNIEFIINIEGKIPRFIFIDGIRLKQVLGNLLSNSIKFTEKGEIELTIKCNLNNEVENMLDIYFEVRDTGIGIAQEHIDTIFGLFSQADCTITRRFGGTGLGLAIVNELLQLMHTKINVTTNVGVGSSFFFTLTLPFTDLEKFQQKNETKTKVALVVDPNKRSGDVISSMLSNIGYKVVENRKQNSLYDLILFDINEPFEKIETQINNLKNKLKNNNSVIIGMLKQNHIEKQSVHIQDRIFDGLLEKPITYYSLNEIICEKSNNQINNHL